MQLPKEGGSHAGHRLLRAVTVLILIVVVYLVLASGRICWAVAVSVQATGYRRLDGWSSRCGGDHAC